MLLEDIVPFMMMGRFEVLSIDGMVAAMTRDGMPRFSMGTPGLGGLLGRSEVADKDANLVLIPDPSCFLSYINSCSHDVEKGNINVDCAFKAGKASTRDIREMLTKPSSGVRFQIARNVEKGAELLHLYPVYNASGQVQLPGGGGWGRSLGIGAGGGRDRRRSGRRRRGRCRSGRRGSGRRRCGRRGSIIMNVDMCFG